MSCRARACSDAPVSRCTMVPYGCHGDGPCPRTGGRDGTSGDAVSDRTSFGLSGPTSWSTGAAFAAGDLVVEIGAGRGALTYALARRGVHVVALEKDPHWADALRREVVRRGLDGGQGRLLRRPRLPHATPAVSASSVRSRSARQRRSSAIFSMIPARVSCVLTSSCSGRWRANAPSCRRRRCCRPPGRRGGRSRSSGASLRAAFRPVPSVDAAVLCVTRRDPPILPPRMAGPYASFVRRQWQ